MTWDVDNISELRRLWSEGLSCSQIAAALGNGITRNAVIGKANRLRLASRKGAPRQPYKKPVRKATARPYKPSPAKSAGIAPMRTPKLVLEAPMGPGVPLVYVTGCKFAVANSSDGTHLFCNAPSHENGPWCEYHRGVCYQKHNPDVKPKRFRIPTSLLRAVA